MVDIEGLLDSLARIRAQVADGEVWRVPRGESGRILAAMGLQHAVQIRQYRALLDEVERKVRGK